MSQSCSLKLECLDHLKALRSILNHVQLVRHVLRNKNGEISDRSSMCLLMEFTADRESDVFLFIRPICYESKRFSKYSGIIFILFRNQRIKRRYTYENSKIHTVLFRLICCSYYKQLTKC